MPTYNTLREANEARQREWDTDDQITNAYRGNEMAGEVGEALEAAVDVLIFGGKFLNICNIIKKLERERMGINGSRATIEDLASEMADAQICLDLAAMKFGINLNRATTKKFNETSQKVGLETRLAVIE